MKPMYSKLKKTNFKNRSVESKIKDKITLPFLAKPFTKWTEKLPETKEHPRNWVVIKDLEITLSNGYILNIKKGTIWDGSSIPKWLWWLFKPIDEGAIGDLIHDELWKQKKEQFKLFNYNIYKTREFSDKERLIWRNNLAPKKKIKNYITHYVIRLIGGFFYSKQLEIPN